MDHPLMSRLRGEFDAGLATFLKAYPMGAAAGLYDPIHYLLQLGGKRLRPVVALAAAEAEGGSVADAMPCAVGLELFHNFTLMHDDIMDEAPKRRGQTTVHKKWDDNTAILSGDAMYTLANAAVSETPSSTLADVLKWFNPTALEVCIGQQLDMSFESREDVALPEYVEMIRLKTSVLLAAAMAMGAASAGASATRQAAWYRFGERVGLAFQLQDDLLDTFGDAAVGKQIGGDILADKKTYLWIHTAQTHSSLLHQHLGPTDNPAEKIEAVRSAMIAAGADVAVRDAMHQYVDEARAILEGFNLDPAHRSFFAGIARHVTERVS